MAGRVAGLSAPAPDNDFWGELEAALVEARACIYAEIRAYPGPIPACDAQYNYLLEQRAQVGQLLARLRDAEGTRSAAAETVAAIGAFVETSSIIDEGSRLDLLERIHTASRRLAANVS
ncbi:MAG: hypothetical protein ACR2RL_13790 [Gammaproteobacteria bacterium]